MSPPNDAGDPPGPPSRPAAGPWRGAGWALLVLAVGWFYAWAPASFPVRWLGTRPEGFYAELGDAFLRGHVRLMRRPDPQLVALPDPYDPAQNQPWRVNDLSYYRGRYYLYHSAVPVVVLYAPVKLLTGRYLTDRAAAFVFCWAGFAAGLLTLLTLRRRALPRCPTPILLACTGMLALGSGYQAVLREPTINHVAIASAYGFLMLALLGVLRAQLPGSRARAWLIFASLTGGLAIASRPNYVIAGLVLLLPAAAAWRRDRWRWSWFLAATLPAAAVIGALLTYNWARFDRPLEFGMRYMLGGWDQRAMGGLSLGNALENARHYLFSAPNFHRDFPFVTLPTWLATGVLIQTPFVWLAPLIGLVWFLKEGAATRTFAVALVIVFAGNLGILLLLPSGNREAVLASANVRYVLDFLPALVLLACLGAMTAGQLLAARPWPRRILAAAAAILALLSMLAGVSLDFQRFPPETYRPLARWLDVPHHAWQWLKADTYGPVSLELRFPADRPGGYEPLVATGTDDGGDLVYVHYVDSGHVRFGLVGIGMPGPISDPIPVNLAETHRVDVFMGSLYPPADAPAFARFGEAQVEFLQRHLRIDLDGRTVFRAAAHFYPASPRHVEVGQTSILLDYSAPRFTGQITSTRRLAILPPNLTPAQTSVYGAVRMVVRFPLHKNWVAEPLLVTGVQQAGDALYAQYVDDERLRLTLDHWGHMSRRSRWLRVDFAADHVLEIWMGSLYPPSGQAGGTAFPPAEVSRWKHRVRVTLDGQTVLDVDQDTYESAPSDVVVGKNVIGASSCGYAFSGEIRDLKRLPPGAGAP